MTTPNKARLLLLKQAADPFVLYYCLYESGTGCLFLGLKDDPECVFYLYPRDNFCIKDLISKPNKSYLVTAKKVGLLTQSDEVLLEAIKVCSQQALDFLKEQAPKDKLFGILSQIDPKIMHWDIDDILRRYASDLSGFQDVPLSIKSVCLANAKLTTEEGLVLLKPSEYVSFFENFKASLLGIIILTVGKIVALSVIAVQNDARKAGLTEPQYIAKNFCKEYPKTGALVLSGEITTYPEYYIACMTESK